MLSSRFTSKLGTNYSATDEEVIEIQDLLVSPTLRWEFLVNDIAELQKKIDVLAQERDSLGSYIAAHRALISPMRRLPLDVIQEIFLDCMPTDRNCVMNASEAPVLLGRICSSWRTLSLTTPRLWSSLHVVEPPIGPDSKSESLKRNAKRTQRLEVTKEWVARSGQCPLSLSLSSLRDRSPGNATSQVHLFVEALIPFSARWQHIHFPIGTTVLQMLQNLSETDVPMLRSAKFLKDYYGAQQTLDWAQLSILRGLSGFCMSAHDFQADQLSLRWEHLTLLALDGLPLMLPPRLTSESMLQVISRCPRLRVCKLMFSDSSNQAFTSAASSPPPFVQLDFLSTLEIYCPNFTPTLFSLLLDRLSLPRLRNFALGGKFRQSHSQPPQVMELQPSYLTRFFSSLANLEKLHLSLDSTESSSSLSDILRCLPPTLQQLRIRDTNNVRFLANHVLNSTSNLDDEVFSVLIPDDTPATSCCPALQELAIDRNLSLSDAAILRFITARMPGAGVSALRRVRIQFEREIQQDIMPELQVQIAAGLAVKITHHAPQSVSPWHGLPTEDEKEWALGWTGFKGYY